MKNKGLYISILILVVVGLFAYLLRDNIKKLFHPLKSLDASPSLEDSKNLGGASNIDLLSKGSTGAQVKELQTMLNNCLSVKNQLPLLVVDGIFGAKTEAALFKVTGKNSIAAKEVKYLLSQYLLKP